MPDSRTLSERLRELLVASDKDMHKARATAADAALESWMMDNAHEILQALDDNERLTKRTNDQAHHQLALEKEIERQINEFEVDLQRLRSLLGESNEVCICGCTAEEHENCGEDGESCDNSDHQCVRTCIAVRDMYAALEADNERYRATIVQLEKERAEAVERADRKQAILDCQCSECVAMRKDFGYSDNIALPLKEIE